MVIVKESTIKGKLKALAENPRFLKIAVFVGLAAMTIILISGLAGKPQTKSTETASKNYETPVFSETDAYTAQIEERLREILSAIEGVGDADIMVTVGATENVVYAKEGKTDGKSTVSDVAVIDGGKKALVERIDSPRITGVVIVCEGGDDSRTVEKVYRAVSAALGVGASHIYVAARE